jgi:tetratricopeptide (TPR) repeat protein
MLRALPLLFGAVATLSVPGSVRAEEAKATIESLRQEEAAQALAEGDLARARHLYQISLVTDPNNAKAHREVGRCSHAMGELHLAVTELRKAAQLSDERDPELHYLLGEALWGTGRRAEALAEYRIAELEIGNEGEDRMESLWLARIHSRRGDHDGADAMYAGMLEVNPTDKEVEFARIENRIFEENWSAAETLLRVILEREPDHTQAKETLAWVLEAQGKAGEESQLRRKLAEKHRAPDFAHTFDHARSLERNGELGAALERYRAAHAIDEHGDRELPLAIRRLQLRLSIEAAAGFVVRTDPSGTVTEYRAGVAVPFADNHQLSLRAGYDTADPRMGLDRATTASTMATLLLGRNRPVVTALMLSGNFRSVEVQGEDARDDLSLGSAAELRAGGNGAVQLHLRADFRMPWREAANTIREGGVYDGATAHVYSKPFGDKLIFDTGAWVRRMELEPLMTDDDVAPHGAQVLAFGGVDFVPWVNPQNPARGEILDEELQWPTYSADALVLSYRHYEGWTDAQFADRLVLAERNQIDELSATARQVLLRGALALEARGGGGYDWAREVSLWRAGGAFLLSPSLRTRLSISYDIASESATGFVGRRHAGWVTLHADL